MTKTTITTPAKRPATLGAELVLVTRDDVEDAMAELGWCAGRIDSAQADLKELHDAIDAKRTKLQRLTIDELETTLLERATQLAAAIREWAAAHLKEHLEGDSRTLKLAHGEVHVKKLPLTIEPLPATVAAAEKAKVSVADFILEKLNAETSCLSKARGVCAMWFVRAMKLLVGDLITVEVRLNKQGQLAAYKAGKLDDKTLKALGLVADDTREAFDFKLKA